jgi:crossover junction endodeoxyribonuclease RuvC
MLRVLGVDPGVARTGVAVVEGAPGALRLVHAECVESSADEPDPQRLHRLFATLDRLVVEHRPDAAAVEQLFFAANRESALRVAQARGVAVCALARAGVAVAEYTPAQVKEAVTGWGGADKAQVARMTCTLVGVDGIPGGADAADACAVAVCHHHRAGLGLAPAVRRRGRGGLPPHLAEAIARAGTAP